MKDRISYSKHSEIWILEKTAYLSFCVLDFYDTGSDHRLPPRRGPPGVWADVPAGSVRRRGGGRLPPRPGPPVDGAVGCRGGNRPPPRRGPPAAAPGSAGVEADAAAGSRRRRGASRPVARRGQPVDSVVGYRPTDGCRGGDSLFTQRGPPAPRRKSRRGQVAAAAAAPGAAAAASY